MKNLILAGLAGCAALVSPVVLAQDAAVQAPADGSQPIEGVAALVNDEVISFTDVRNRARMILLGFGAQITEELVQQAEQEAIESLIEEKLKFQEFQELTEGDTIEDAEIERDIARLAQRNGLTVDAFLANFQQAGINPDTIRNQLRADIAWAAIVRGRFAQQVRVSELRVDSMLERLETSQNEEQYRIGEIFLYAPDASSQTVALERAETLKRQIEQGAPFDQVAQQFSAAPSASAGGELGWLTRADIRPEVMTAVENATPPVLLPPIASENGVYLVALLGKREPTTGDEVSLNLRQAISQSDEAMDKLTQLKADVTACSGLQAAANSIGDVNIVDMGEIDPEQLTDPFKSAVEDLETGESTEVMDLGPSKMMLFVCSRSTGGAQLPTRDELRDRLFDTEISMLADRYLRDIRREATIDVR